MRDATHRTSAQSRGAGALQRDRVFVPCRRRARPLERVERPRGRTRRITGRWTMSRTGRLAGKIALVTGGSRGLGRGIAEGFAAEGAKLVVNYLKDEKSANAVVDTIKRDGGEAISVRADIYELEHLTDIVHTAVKRFETIYILDNNAGKLNSFKLSDMSVETWDNMVKVHLRGMFLCTRFVIPH